VPGESGAVKDSAATQVRIDEANAMKRIGTIKDKFLREKSLTVPKARGPQPPRTTRGSKAAGKDTEPQRVRTIAQPHPPLYKAPRKMSIADPVCLNFTIRMK